MYLKNMTIETELKDIKTSIESLKSRKIRAEVEVEQATTLKEQALNTLTEKFKVGNSEEAKDLVDKLKIKLENKVQEIRKELEKVQD